MIEVHASGIQLVALRREIDVIQPIQTEIDEGAEAALIGNRQFVISDCTGVPQREVAGAGTDSSKTADFIAKFQRRGRGFVLPGRRTVVAVIEVVALLIRVDPGEQIEGTRCSDRLIELH